MHVDLIFRVLGSTIPRDHGYGLYAAISRAVEAIHGARDIAIFPIRATPDGRAELLLNERSQLRIRVPAERLPLLLPLAGRVLALNGHKIRLGVPRVEALVPAATLSSPLVLIKLANENAPPSATVDGAATTAGGIVTPDAFLAAARKKLDAMGIGGEACIQQIRTGPRAGQVRRRVIRVKEQTHVGYAMTIHSLTAEESILLQEQGLGGRRLMGCGSFLPDRGRPHVQSD